jgi:hypothetical protein
VESDEGYLMPKDANQWDVALAHSGVTHTYKLAVAEDILQWFAGLVEELSPQEHSGAFSYEAMPTSLSSPITFESWHRGAGHSEMLSEKQLGDSDTNGLAYHGYSYSRGVDASWDRLQLSPERQETEGVTGTVIGHYSSPTFGEHLWTNQRVYEWTGLSWVLRYDAGDEVVTDVTEWSNSVGDYLMVAHGDDDDIRYSENGTSWETWEGQRAKYLAVRGVTALNPILVGVSSTGAVRTATTIAGDFTADDQVGLASTDVNGVEVLHDLLVVLKEDGVYTFDGTDIAQILSPTALWRSDNGSAHTVGYNGRLYYNFGNKLMELDVLQSTLETVFSMEHPELNGTIETVTTDHRNLYLTLLNSDGNRYVMKGAEHDSHWHWHTFIYLGSALPASSIHVAAGTRIHGTNPALVTADDYYILPRDSLRPEDDTNYRFDTGGGFIVGPLVDAGARVFKKFLNGARVVLEAATASRPTAISYGIDRHDATPTSLLTAVQSGLTSIDVSTEVGFTRIHYYATLSTGDNRHSPRVLAIVFDSTPMPPRRRRFTFIVEVEHMEVRRGSGDPLPYSYIARESHLYNGVDKYVTLTDLVGRTFSVKIRDVVSQGVKRKTGVHGGAHALLSNIQIIADEIIETTPSTPLAVWDQSSYDDGSVYSGT